MTTEILPVYPRGDLDMPAKFLSLIGTFWSMRFKDKEIPTAILTSRSMLYEQTWQDTLEAQNAVSRYTVPVFHNILWKPLTLSQNLSTTTDAAPLQYGEDQALYGEAAERVPYNREFVYGDTLARSTNGVFPLPDDIKHIRMLCNRLTNPTLVLVEGVDFRIDNDNDLLILGMDVFNDDRIATRDVVNSTGVADTEALLWAFSTDVDREDIWRQFGYVLNYKTDSSEGYRNYLNAIWDMHTWATYTEGLLNVFSSLWDVPLVEGDTETVEKILTGRKLQIVTNARVYDYPLGSTPIVEVGDTVYKNDRLVDTLTVIDPSYIDGGDAQLQALISSSTDIPLPVATQLPSGHIWSGGVLLAPQLWDPFRRARAGGYRKFYEFSGTAGTEVSLSSVTQTKPQIGYDFTFNGYFKNETATLTKTTLPDHDRIRVVFDLLIIGDWAGNEDGVSWELLVDGERIMKTSFSNYSEYPQAYPDAYGTAANPARTGAAVNNDASKLIYATPTRDAGAGTALTGENTTYHFDFTVLHTDNDIELQFIVNGLPDNTWCAVDPVPYSTYRQDGILDATSGKYEIQPASEHPIYKGCYTKTQFESTFGFDPEVCMYDLADSRRYGYMGTGQIGSTLWDTYGVIPYPGACWGIKDMTLTVLKSTRRELPEYMSNGIYEPNVQGISIGSRFLSDTYFSTLFFPNKELPLEYLGKDDYGRVEVRFEVSGYPGDVEQFWDSVQERGRETGYTLANYLDQRVNPFGDPSKNDLPDTVNPMRLVLRHILGYNLLIVKMKSGLEGQNARSPGALNLLRQALPPHVAYIIFLELVIDDELITTPITDDLVTGSGPVIEEIVNVTLTERAPGILGVVGTIV